GQGGIVDIGDNAYLFPSQAAGQVTDCFILAHGGTPSDTGLQDYRFTVPAGCSVYFFVAGGMTNRLPGPGDPVGGFRAICGSVGSPSMLQSPRPEPLLADCARACRYGHEPARLVAVAAALCVHPQQESLGEEHKYMAEPAHFGHSGLGCERGE